MLVWACRKSPRLKRTPKDSTSLAPKRPTLVQTSSVLLTASSRGLWGNAYHTPRVPTGKSTSWPDQMKIQGGEFSPGDNFATLEIPKAPSKHVSRKMSLNFRKMI